MGFEGDDLDVVVKHPVGMQFLVVAVAGDADIDAVAESEPGAFIFGRVALRMEAESDFQMAGGVLAVGMQMHRIGNDISARTQQPAGVLVEDVRIAAHLVYRPGCDGVVNALAAVVDFGGAPDHVVENVASAHGLPAGARLIVDVVDFDDLNRLDVAFLVERYGNAVDFAPPVRGAGELGHRIGRHDQVGLARGPLDAVVEYQRLGRVDRVALGRAGLGPDGNRLDFGVVQRRIVLVILDADVLFHVPRRHGAGAVADAGLVFDQAGERSDLFISDERHGADAADAVAILATPLQDRFDVLVESNLVLLGVRREGRGQAQQRK